MLINPKSTDISLAAIEAALPINPQPYRIGSRPTGLILIDIINGFCSVGHGFLSPIEANEQIMTMVLESDRLAKAFSTRKLPILAFLDSHEPGKLEPPYPPHCEKGSGEEKLVPQLEWLENDHNTTLINKDCINGFIGAINPETGNNLLLEWIFQKQLQALVIVGICTDICVMDFVVTMLSARNHNLTPTLKEIIVYTKGCATYDLSLEMATKLSLPKTAIHPQRITHHLGLYTMATRGAFIASEIVL